MRGKRQSLKERRELADKRSKLMPKIKKEANGKSVTRNKRESARLLKMTRKPKSLVTDKSVIIGEHRPNCTAKKSVESKIIPFEWNILEPNIITTCDESGTVLTKNEMTNYNQPLHVFYELSCIDHSCNCVKRVRATDVALI